MGPRQQKAGKPKATPGRQKPKKSTAQSRAKTRKSVKPEAVERDPERVPFDRSRLRPPLDREAREAMEKAWIQKERRRRSRPAKQWAGRPWGLNRIDRHKLEHFRAWCGKSEFDLWLHEREWSAERGDWGAITELVGLDLVYAARYRDTLEQWQDLAGSGSSLAVGYLKDALGPTKRRKRGTGSIRAAALRSYHDDLLRSGEARGGRALEETATWWEEFAGESLDIDNLKNNIIYSKRKPVLLDCLQPYEVLDMMSRIFPVYWRILRPNLTILWDSCNKRCRYWIEDWWAWKKTLRFRDHRDACLKLWGLLGGIDADASFKGLISAHDELVNQQKPISPNHCMRKIQPFFYRIPCPYETEISRWKRDPDKLLEFARNIRGTLGQITQSLRHQWLDSL